MNPRRMIVCQPGSPGDPALACGAVPGSKSQALIVKGTFRHDEEGSPVLSGQAPSLGRASPDDPASESRFAGDLAASHATPALLLRHAGGGTPSLQVLDRGGGRRAARVMSQAPGQTAYHLDAPFAAGDVIEIASAGGVLQRRLPESRPVLHLDGGRAPVRTVQPVCDTAVLDVERRSVEMVWRSVVEAPRLGAWTYRRMIAAFAPPGRGGYAEVLPGLARGRFAFAVTPSVPSPEPQDDREREDLVMARHEALEHLGAPAMGIERYAAISAELAAGSEPRLAILARHGLSADDWDLEEAAWLEALGTDVKDRGDASRVELYSKAFRSRWAEIGDRGRAPSFEEQPALLRELEAAGVLPGRPGT